MATTKIKHRVNSKKITDQTLMKFLFIYIADSPKIFLKQAEMMSMILMIMLMKKRMQYMGSDTKIKQGQKSWQKGFLFMVKGLEHL